jgi:hypothetical protein
LQVSRAADPETLQSQLAKTARKRLSLSGLELLHGRLNRIIRENQPAINNAVELRRARYSMTTIELSPRTRSPNR